MTKILAILLLLFLFFAISKSADLIVLNLRKAGEKLGIKIFFLGMILGLMTTLPEIAIGINSAINGIPEISFGNMVGGVLVLFGLILPISIILNRKIKTEKGTFLFSVVLLFLFLPLLLGLKGYLNYIDGLILILSYATLIYLLYRKHREKNSVKIEIVNRKEIGKHFLLVTLGLVGLIIFSNLIVDTTIYLLKGYNISVFIVGLLLYAFGTNLPELIIAIRSYKRKVEELSFSNLIGSAMGNSLAIGALSLAKTITVEVNLSYLFLTIFNLIFFSIFFIFYKTDKLLVRKEGLFILFLYLFFLAGQIFIQLR